MSFYVNNTFGKFQAETDFETTLPSDATLVTGYERALGEQHKLYSELDVTEGQVPTLAVYKHGPEGSHKWDLVAISGSGDTYEMLEHYGEFDEESKATDEFDGKLGECADPNAEYDASTDTCGCKAGYSVNSDTGDCDPDEPSFLEENGTALGVGVGIMALLGFFLLKR